MKKVMDVFFLIICLILIIVTLFNNTNLIKTKNLELPISLGYVYSESMEPVIKTNDGYFLIRSKNYKVNDIVTFQPNVLKEEYVTHRIVEMTSDNLYITKGDHNASTDQEGGEPPIQKDQISGKVLTIHNRPIIVPYLGTLSSKFKDLTQNLNIFYLISIIILIYLALYIIENFLNKRNTHHRKRISFLHIVPYFDPILFLFCSLLFANAIFIGITFKSWKTDELSFVVVNTKGLSSPTPGQKFTQMESLENSTLIPYITVLKPENTEIEVHPKKLFLNAQQNAEYSLTIIAPENPGLYKEKIIKRSYPNLLPGRLFDYLYSKHDIMPLIIIFMPGLFLNLLAYVWWMSRWKMGRRQVMDWLIPFRTKIRRLLA